MEDEPTVTVKLLAGEFVDDAQRLAFQRSVQMVADWLDAVPDHTVEQRDQYASMILHGSGLDNSWRPRLYDAIERARLERIAVTSTAGGNA